MKKEELISLINSSFSTDDVELEELIDILREEDFKETFPGYTLGAGLIDDDGNLYLITKVYPTIWIININIVTKNGISKTPKLIDMKDGNQYYKYELLSDEETKNEIELLKKLKES